MLQAGIIFFLTITLFGAAWAQPLKEITFIPQWIPQSQFAGYYVAKNKGLYKKRGLNVKILQGGPDKPSSVLVEQGAAQFGSMFLSTAILKRSQGVPIVNLCQLVQQSSLMLVAKSDSGIRVPVDMHGKKVGLWGAEFQIQPRAFFKHYNITVNEVPQSTTVNLFLRGGVQVASAMWYNEYHTIINSGIDPDELTTFFFFDYGLNFPEDGIYCLEKTYLDDPATCKAFVAATLEGWRYALENPGEAVQIVMQKIYDAHLPSNRAHQRWMLDRMRDIMIQDGMMQKMGTLNKADFSFVVRQLKELGIITQTPGFESFYRDCTAP